MDCYDLGATLTVDVLPSVDVAVMVKMYLYCTESVKVMLPVHLPRVFVPEVSWTGIF